MKYAHQVIVGDFNKKDINWNTIMSPCQYDGNFIEAVRDSFLTQHIRTPTRGRGTNDPSLLDLITSARLAAEVLEWADFKNGSSCEASRDLPCACVIRIILQSFIGEILTSFHCWNMSPLIALRRRNQNGNFSFLFAAFWLLGTSTALLLYFV